MKIEIGKKYIYLTGDKYTKKGTIIEIQQELEKDIYYSRSLGFGWELPKEFLQKNFKLLENSIRKIPTPLN